MRIFSAIYGVSTKTVYYNILNFLSFSQNINNAGEIHFVKLHLIKLLWFKQVKVCVGCGIFATMNPAGAKYGGRRKLPEGLNRLFRPCAMCQPHVAHISSALLAAQGYTKSEEIAEKLILCFDMAK